MKRILALLLVVAALCTVLFVPASAAGAPISSTQNERIDFEDGSYIEVTLEAFSITRAGGSVGGNKYYTYKTDDGVEKWQIKLSGDFTYTGTSSKCTNASCTVTIYDSHWYTISKSAYPSGSSAIAEVEMGRKLLGVTTFKDTYTVKLTCDKNGNLS